MEEGKGEGGDMEEVEELSPRRSEVVVTVIRYSKPSNLHALMTEIHYLQMQHE